jgi:hypothetical protein
MAKFSDKRMGKEVGQASVYAKPHTMDSAAVNVTNAIPTVSGATCMDNMNMSVGGISKGNYKPVKTDGVKIRGTGAATKGVMARGPMA